MSKKGERKQSARHMFSLRPKEKQCFYQKQILIKFCESPQEPNIEQSPCYEGPIFNKDGNFLTSSFILNSEQNKFKAGKDITENENKYHNYTEEKSELLVPKPNSKNMYCNVCKEKYEDYREHIIKSEHKKKVRNSQFNVYIIELEKKFRRVEPSPSKLKEKEMTRTETENIIIIDDSSVEEIQMSLPKKRVKIDNSGLTVSEKNNCVEKIGKPVQLGIQEDKKKSSWETGWTNICPMGSYPQHLFHPYFSYNMISPFNSLNQLANLSSHYLQTYSYPNSNFNPFAFQTFTNYHQTLGQNLSKQINN